MYSPASDLRVLLARLGKQDLGLGLFQALGFPVLLIEFRIVHHQPTAAGFVGAGLAIDSDAHVDFSAMFFAGSGSQRRFDGVEDNLLVDTLFVGHHVDNQQDLFIHLSLFPIKTPVPDERSR